MDLKDEINKLAQLQEFDSKIFNLSKQKDIEKPAQQQMLKEELEKKRNNLKKFEEKFRNLQLEKKDKELEFASKEEGMHKAQGQLYQLKTNKEYQSKLSEINSKKADVSVLEETVLKLIENLEKAEAELKELKDSLAGEEKKIMEEDAAIIEQLSRIKGEIDVLEGKKSILARDIDKSIFKVYEKLIVSRLGLAIAPLQNESCGACYMKASHQKINEIKMYKDLVFCGSCLRILYIPEDFEIDKGTVE